MGAKWLKVNIYVFYALTVITAKMVAVVHKEVESFLKFSFNK